MTKSLLLVCDDAGFASVQRGILRLAEVTSNPLCAEYLISQPGAAKRAKEMSSHPLVSIGLHFELSTIPDMRRVEISKELKEKGTTLGEQSDIQEQATRDAANQLTIFRQALGRDPAHISTHGDFNIDVSGAVMPWWMDLMSDLFDGDVPPMQMQYPHVRHNMTSWYFDPTKRDALTPDEFEEVLRKQTSDIVEFVLHPAWPEPGDASLDMKFTAEMRMRDVNAAIAIINSGCIERSGFDIVPVSSLQ